VESVRASLEAPTTLNEIVFCCFSAADLMVYEQALSATNT
jgi:hypothetical protein